MEMTDIILKVITAIVLFATLIFVALYWAETQQMKKEMIQQNKIVQNNIYYQKLPVIDFEVSQDYQDSHNISDVIHIKNKGAGPAINVSVNKLPAADNGQKVAVSGAQRKVNEGKEKAYSVIGIDEKNFFFKEYTYNGKRIKIMVLFSDVFGRRFHWEFEGEPSNLKLTKYHIDGNK